MKKSLWCLLVGVACAALRGPEPAVADDAKQDKKGVVVTLDGLKSTAPAEWKQEEPSNKQMRLYQFRLAKVDGDKHDAELVIFFFGPGGGGSADANIDRWKKAFIPPEGKSIDDMSKVTKMKVGDVDVTYVDIQGTYKYKERPFDPNAKEERRPDWRQLGIVFESKKGPYFFRLVGPAKTVTQYRKGFDDWLKGFKPE
jgi:hypothetical protein